MSKDLAMQQSEEQLWDLHESGELVPLEFTEETKPSLFGIEPEKAQEMVSGLSSVIAERDVLKNAYIDVINLPITTENLSTFKELRLKFVKVRTSIDKWHKVNKAFYLAGGRFVDAIKNKEIGFSEEMESKLLEAEKFFENQEKERLALLKKEREELLQPFVDNLPGGLEDLDQDVFDSFLETKKKAHADKIESERLESERLENERIAREKEIEDQRVENERLKAEALAKEKALEKERAETKAKQDAIELKAKQEREQAEKEKQAEADKQAKIQAEKDAEIAKLKAQKEKEESDRIAKEKADKLEADKLAKAPIKKQLSVWVESFNIPVVGVDNETSKEIIAKFDAFKKWSITQINNL